jgi:aldose 1-epimerase
MEHVLYPQPGYPFTLGISIEYVLSEAGLQVRTTATNLGSDPCPYGSGAHPYLTLGTAAIDHLVLRVPARTVLRSDERGLPFAAQVVEGTEYDFQQPRRIGSTMLDHAFTDLSGIKMASLVSNSEIRTTGLISRSGSTGVTRT